MLPVLSLSLTSRLEKLLGATSVWDQTAEILGVFKNGGGGGSCMFFCWVMMVVVVVLRCLGTLANYFRYDAV